MLMIFSDLQTFNNFALPLRSTFLVCEGLYSSDFRSPYSAPVLVSSLSLNPLSLGEPYFVVLGEPSYFVVLGEPLFLVRQGEVPFR